MDEKGLMGIIYALTQVLSLRVLNVYMNSLMNSMRIIIQII